MITVFALTSIMVDLPQWHEHKGETQAETWHRLRPVAGGIHRAAQRATCYGRTECERVWPHSTKSAMAALITTGWWESRFAQHVIDHKCRAYECDPVKLADGSTYHKSIGAWQQQVAGPIKFSEWKTLPGDPYRQAWAAVRVLSSSKKVCKTWNGMFSIYATGRWCGWKHSAARVRTFNRVLTKIKALPDSDDMMQ